MPSFTLTITNGPNVGRTVALGVDQLVVGRGADADLSVIDPRMSRAHFQLSVSEGALRIADLNSSNGTFVNSRRVTEGTLRAGDMIVAGDTHLRVDSGVDAPQVSENTNVRSASGLLSTLLRHRGFQ